MRLRAALCVLLMSLAACASPVRTNYYYTLSGVSQTLKAESGASAYRVSIGPISVPETLDRQQIVLRVAPNRYSIADNQRWSEPLKREIPRVLAEEVGKRLPLARVAVQSQNAGQDADYRVFIDVLRFESIPGESIALEAAWSLRNRAGVRVHEAQSVFVESVDTPGIAPLVSAHSKALAALAREIAAALEAVVAGKHG